MLRVKSLFSLRVSASGEGVETAGERECSAGSTQHRAQFRAPSHGPEIMTRVEIKSWTLNSLGHVGAPKASVLKNSFN